MDLGFDGYIEFDAGNWLEYAYTERVTAPAGARESVLYFLYGSNGKSLPVPMADNTFPWRKIAEIDVLNTGDRPSLYRDEDKLTNAHAAALLRRGDGYLPGLRVINNYLRSPGPGLEYYCTATNEHYLKLHRANRLLTQPTAIILPFARELRRDNPHQDLSDQCPGNKKGQSRKISGDKSRDYHNLSENIDENPH